GLFPLAKKVFGGVTRFLDGATEKIKPFAEQFSNWVVTRVVPAAESLLGKVGELGDKVREFFESSAGQQLKTETLEKLGSIFDSLKSAGEGLLPAVKDIMSSLSQATAAIGISTWKLLLDTLDILAGLLGDVLVPALQSIASWMKDHKGTVTVLVGAYTSYRLAVLGTAGATKVLAAAQKVQAAGGLVSYLKNLLTQTRLVSTATKVWTGIQWLFNAAMSANPIGLVVVAIAALVAGIVLAYKRSETFRNIVQTAFRDIGVAATWLWENAIKPSWDAIKKAFDVVAAAVTWWWRNVTVPAFNAVAAAARWLFDQVKRSFSFWKGVFDQVRAWASQARDWIVGRFNSVVDFVRGLPGRISSAARGMWDGIRNAFRAAINWIIDRWNNLSFTLPSVNIPGLGKVGGFTLNTPNIPRLAQGGIVPATPGGRIVRV